MKIGITQPAIAPDMVGLSNVFALLKKALAQRHMVLELPPGHDRHSKSQRRLSAEQFVLECDAILGAHLAGTSFTHPLQRHFDVCTVLPSVHRGRGGRDRTCAASVQNGKCRCRVTQSG